MARTRVYRSGVLEDSDCTVDELAEHLKDTDTVVWLGLESPTEQELEEIGERLGLHKLAIEDALGEHERPKFDRYNGHSYLSMKAVLDADEEFRLSVVSAFITDTVLVTVHGGEFDVTEVEKRWDAAPDIATSGVAYLLHGLLDTIVDGHFDATQVLDAEVEAIEEALFEEKPDHHGLQRRALRLRKNLGLLRRAEMPMADVVGPLLRREDTFVDDETRPYYQDVYDHILRVNEWTDSLREMTGTLRETQLNLQGNVLNLIMKKVTSWAAIIAVPTAITGFYGQNLPYPGFEQPWGFWVSTVAIVALSGWLYVMFKRRDWL
jgi:magnesium transporter